MWPGKDEALSRTVEAEEATRELYLEAIRRWAPSARAAVLPALTASVLPPDPEAVATTQAVWDEHAAEIVLAGLGVLWAVAAYETATGLGQELADTVTPEVSTVVLGIVLASVVLTRKDVLAAVTHVESTPQLKSSRDAYLENTRAEVAATPGRVQAKVTAALNEPRLTMSVIPEDRPEVLRARAAEVLAANSPELWEVASVEGYQAAGLMNHAVLAAAQASEYADELEKTWVCVHPDTVVSALGVTHLARRHYEGPLYAVRTTSGAAVSLTPQHRVLTGRGWIEAQFLHEGDDLFKVTRADTAGAPDIQDPPAAIGQVVDAAMDATPTKVRTVRRGVDLDGDPGSRYVDVVATDGNLSINAEASCGEALRDLLLTDANALGEAALLGGGRPNHCICRLDPTPVLSGDALVKLGLDVVGDFRCAQNAGRGLVANLNSASPKNICDLSRPAVVALAERVGGFPCEVGGDDLVGRCVEIGSAFGGVGELLSSPHLGEPLGGLRSKLAGLAGGSEGSPTTNPAADGFGANSNVGRNVVHGLPGQIATDDFVGIEPNTLGVLARDRIDFIARVEYSGHVYDLSTSSHTYLANDLVIHNCTIDGKTRPSHFAADGARVPLAGLFSVGGAQLAYPGDPTGPPAEVKNCRCRMGILAKDEPLPDEVDRHTERLDGRDSVAINRHGRTQEEEIERRAREGNIRARDTTDGVGRVASAAPNEENAMAGQDQDTYLTFTDALFAVTGVPTSDGRMLAADIALSFRDAPLPLQWCKENEGGHYGSVTVGVIESLSYEGGEVRASGYMLNNDDALEAIDLVSHGVCNPSVDLANCRMIASDLDGHEVSEANYVEGMDVYATVTEAEVIAATLVATPAFGQTRFGLNEQREARSKSLVAAAAEAFRPRVYDPALFADPKLSGPTLPTITEDGHIFGHIACWGEKHRSIQANGMTPPRSKSGYRHFHTSPPVHLSDGSTLPVGRLTVGTGHAADTLSAGPAAAHYDNTGTCFGLVRVGEDRHGIWFSGVVAPWATAEQVEMGLSAPLSGDWRWIDGQLELVASLSVNTPGFITRAHTGRNGVPKTLVASLGLSRQTEAGGISHFTADDIKAAVVAGVAEERRNWELAQRRQAALARATADLGVPPAPPTPAERLTQLLGRV